MYIYIARHSVAHAANPSIQEAETGGSQTSYQSKLHTNYCTKNKNNINKTLRTPYLHFLPPIFLLLFILSYKYYNFQNTFYFSP